MRERIQGKTTSEELLEEEKRQGSNTRDGGTFLTEHCLLVVTGIG